MVVVVCMSAAAVRSWRASRSVLQILLPYISRSLLSNRERGARGAAPTIGSVTNLMEAAVEEAGSQRTQTTTINSTEVPEETQPQHSGTTAEERGARETTSGTKMEADNLGQQGNLIQTHGK